MLNKVAVEGIRLYAYHGCLEEEARIGGNYIVDVYLETDFREAANTDDLAKTVDYCAIYQIAKKEMAQRSKLIEHVAQRIHNSITAGFPAVASARVRVTKLNPPIDGSTDKVFVEIE